MKENTHLQTQNLNVKILWLKMGSWFPTNSIIILVNVGPTLAKKIEHSSKCPTHFISYDAVHRFDLEPVTENELLKIISNFSDSSAGWDDLKPSMIKKIKHPIAIPLTHICNLSFNTGVFPSEFKVANVVPIFKSGDEMLFSNYRPVSVLPVFSKIYERLILQPSHPVYRWQQSVVQFSIWVPRRKINQYGTCFITG